MYPSYVRHEQKGNSLYYLYNSSVNLKSLQNNKTLHILDNYSGDILILAQVKKPFRGLDKNGGVGCVAYLLPETHKKYIYIGTVLTENHWKLM